MDDIDRSLLSLLEEDCLTPLHDLAVMRGCSDEEVVKRKKQLEESETEIKRLQTTVEEKMTAYEEKLRQAKAAAIEQKNEIIRQGAEEARAVTDAVRAEIPGMMERFQTKMAVEIDAANKILADHSRQLSVEIAEKILGRSL